MSMKYEMIEFSSYQTAELMEIQKLVTRLDELGFPFYCHDKMMTDLNEELKKRKDKPDIVNNEKELYEKYVGKTVRITKVLNNKNYFYKGKLTQVIGNKIILIDERVGQLMFSFDVIKTIEEA